MINSILVPLTDSPTSRSVIEYLCTMAVCREDLHVTLLHVLLSLPEEADIMGTDFVREQPARMREALEGARERLVERGFNPRNVEIRLETEPYPTVADAIIGQFRMQTYDLVVIGRKKMTKSEEFLFGDISVKLIRSLQGTAVLVVKPT